MTTKTISEAILNNQGEAILNNQGGYSTYAVTNSRLIRGVVTDINSYIKTVW